MKQKGFTLIEVVIVLTIVGLVIGGLFIPLKEQIEAINVQHTKKILAQAETALLNYAALYNHLPCPAVDDKGIATDVEHPNCQKEGYLPWANLGIHQYDAWGNLLRYRAIPAYTQQIVTSKGTLNTSSEIIQLQDRQGEDVIDPNEIVAVILSYGKDKNPNPPLSQASYSPNTFSHTVANIIFAKALAADNDSGISSNSTDPYIKCNTSDCNDIIVPISRTRLTAKIVQWKIPDATIVIAENTPEEETPETKPEPEKKDCQVEGLCYGMFVID